MASVSEPGPIIYSIGEQSNADPTISKTVEERLKDILGKFKDTQNIIYVNIEKVVIDAPERARSRSRNRSRSGSRSRSRSHSHHRKGKHHRRHHSRGPRPHHGPMFHHRFPHFFHHHGRHHPYQYFSSDVEETNCDVTTGAETTEEYTEVENCCRRHRRDRRHSRSRSRGGRSKSRGKGGKKNGKCWKKGNTPGPKESTDQEVIVIDNEEPKNTEGDLEKSFDNLNVSKSS